ncbi:MAG: ABC transporter permease [Solirubrobacteraceae bacterium]
MSRVAVATRLGFREQARRPLLLVLLVGLPFFFITRAIALTEQLPRTVGLPGGGEILTNMRDIHGADMAAITVGFLAGLVGVFVMQSARQADRRLVVAGFRPREALAPRLLVLAAATVLVVVVSVAVTALSFTPRLWAPFIAGILLVGLIYGMLGALAGAVVGQLGATYLMLFGAMLDLGVVQNPMFGSGAPAGWGAALPGYGPGRVIIDAGFSDEFHAWGALALGLVWTLVLALAVLFVLGRLVGMKDHGKRDADPAPPVAARRRR